MPVYNFKALPAVPTASDFIDVVLSKTQRQTPTVVRNRWQISRIRSFYMRKVKYTQQNLHEKLKGILDCFPRLDDIHPFYADLLNVLYDRDHYKLALGQLGTAVNLIDKIAKDYVRLLKYGDSLYRCKQLKRAALGRMCTLMKKHKASLAYLEQVRQHMSRLPSIDPNTRTILVCGYPNVGKSSFMNKITRADVEVQPYAFTTKSLYVGHMDYKYLRWQVIDTPGILDRPLENRNTIEMQSVTALAHLRSVILYIVDISEECGYTIQQQSALFHSIKPLFANKPLLVVVNKTDVRSLDSLNEADKELVEEMRQAADVNSSGIAASIANSVEGSSALVAMSTLTEDGVNDVKTKACEMLLMSRVDQKLKSKKTNDILNRLHVALPSGAARQPHIPASVLAATGADGVVARTRRTTEKDLQEESGGAGVYSADLRKNYMLENEEWKYDKIPEIYLGHNVADFVDPDIDERLAELEREEEELLKIEEANAMGEESEEELDEEEKALLGKIRARKSNLVAEHRRKKQQNAAQVPRKHDVDRRQSTRRMKSELEGMGMDASKAVDRVRGRSQTRRNRKRGREEGAEEGGEEGEGTRSKSRARSQVMGRVHSSKSRSRSRGPSVAFDAKPGQGFKNAQQKMKSQILSDKMQRKMQKLARKGEGDRHIPNEMPKHLFSGKRGIGKTDRR